MIRVTFDPTQLTGPQQQWWKDWTERAEKATANIITAWETWLDDGAVGKFKPTFDEDVWKDVRDWLLENVFNMKCAYCETPMVRARHHGEHFRPKGQVKARPLGMKTMKPGMTFSEWQEAEAERIRDVPHPGYFWLAYNWKNIVPACEFCNTGQGKKDQFPVKQRHVAAKRVTSDTLASLREHKIRSSIESDLFYLQPDDLDTLEDRFLIHPYFDNPADDLEFEDNGFVLHKPGRLKGEHSIAVYDLNGREVVQARFEIQTLIVSQYLSALSGFPGTILQRRQAAEVVIADYRNGRKAYSAAVMAAVRKMLANSPLDPDLPL